MLCDARGSKRAAVCGKFREQLLNRNDNWNGTGGIDGLGHWVAYAIGIFFLFLG